MLFWRFYLNTEVATVNVVPEEQVPRCRWWSSHFKQLHKIKELPMDVPTHWKTIKRKADVAESKNRIDYLWLRLFGFVRLCVYHPSWQNTSVVIWSFWQGPLIQGINHSSLIAGWRGWVGCFSTHSRINWYGCKNILPGSKKNKKTSMFQSWCVSSHTCETPEFVRRTSDLFLSFIDPEYSKTRETVENIAAGSDGTVK